jgi:hypothetical protein
MVFSFLDFGHERDCTSPSLGLRRTLQNKTGRWLPRPVYGYDEEIELAFLAFRGAFLT